MERLLDYWGHVLERLQKDPEQLNREIDWIIKYHLLQAFQARHQIQWNDHRMLMFDLQYHDTRPSKGLYHRLLKKGRVDRIVTQDEVVHAVTNPPTSTRAYFRGTCLKKYADQIHGASWNSLIFDISGSSMDKIFLNHPTRGTKSSKGGDLLHQCATAADLVQAFRENERTASSKSDTSHHASAEAPNPTGEEG